MAPELKPRPFTLLPGTLGKVSGGRCCDSRSSRQIDFPLHDFISVGQMPTERWTLGEPPRSGRRWISRQCLMLFPQRVFSHTKPTWRKPILKLLPQTPPKLARHGEKKTWCKLLTYLVCLRQETSYDHTLVGNSPSHLDGEVPEGNLRNAFADLLLTSTFKAEKWATSRLD